ncbi:MAG: hypothetical protein ACYDDF_01200 [Thermoplasmatota archaeon]
MPPAPEPEPSPPSGEDGKGPTGGGPAAGWGRASSPPADGPAVETTFQAVGPSERAKASPAHERRPKARGRDGARKTRRFAPVDAAHNVRAMLRASWAIYRANWPVSIFVAAVPNIAYAVLTVAAVPYLPRGLSWGDALPYVILIALVTAAYLLGIALAAAALGRIGHEHLMGNVREARDILSTWEAVRYRMKAIVATAVRAALFTAGGVVALVVPGVRYLSNILVAGQVAMFEWRSGREAVSRSRELLEGWRVVGLATFLLLAIPWAGIAAIVAFAPLPVLTDAVVFVVVATLPLPWVVYVTNVLYRAALGYPVEGLSTPATPAGPPPAPARALADRPAAPAARPNAPRPTSQGGMVRYTCPHCERGFILPHLPPPGTLCPDCRKRASGSAPER